MDKLSCIIVEDELPALEELKYMLSRYDFIDLIGTAQDGGSAYALIKQLNPDVIFMDINIPVENGISLANKVKLENKDIEVVFVTAYEQHALKAFELDASDYILKPLDERRLSKTLNKLYEKHKKSNDDLSSKISQIISRLDINAKYTKKLPCEYNDKIVLIDINDINYFFTEGEKAYAKTKDKKYLINFTLQELEEKTGFFRAHRGYLINLDNIKEIFTWFNGTYKIIMDDAEKSEIPLSRSNVKKLKELLDI